MNNKLFEFTMRVLPGDGCDLPEGMRGAYVPCYAGATDYQLAVKNGVAAVSAMHYKFDNIKGEVREISIATWTSYVALVWPDFADHFPSQDELPELIAKGGVFLGPFLAFKD